MVEQTVLTGLPVMARPYWECLDLSGVPIANKSSICHRFVTSSQYLHALPVLHRPPAYMPLIKNNIILQRFGVSYSATYAAAPGRLYSMQGLCGLALANMRDLFLLLSIDPFSSDGTH